VRLELTEVLACPRCGPDHGLIAFVDQMEGRRITSGRLDCPNCEERHPIVDGVVHMRGSDRADVGDPMMVTTDSGLVDLAAALLGAPTGSEVLFVGPGLASIATLLADRRPQASVLAYAYPTHERHERVHWIVPAPGSQLPMRSARLHGALATGASSIEPAEAGRVLVPGCRLVILTPEAEALTFLEASPVRELASDSRAWVGIRM